jgi:hypothetical protein
MYRDIFRGWGAQGFTISLKVLKYIERIVLKYMYMIEEVK